MARTTITPQDTSHRDGLVVDFSEQANADGNAVVNNGRRRLLIRNDDTAAHTVTQVTGGTVHGVDVADPPVSVPAGGVAVLGPWPAFYNQPDGSTHVDYDAVTSLFVAAVEG